MNVNRLGALFTVLFCAVSGSASEARADTAEAKLPVLLAATEGPSEGELEFWRSAQRIDTPASYRAYLEAFPRGLFSGLARLKLTKEAATADPQRPSDLPPPAAPTGVAARPTADLRYFSKPTVNSGALIFNLGDRIAGPGVLTVGSIGAKKQIVLPAGEWILLAAVDTKSVQPPVSAIANGENRVSLTTISFGRFAGDRLIALMRFTTNTQIASGTSWTDIVGCDQSNAANLEHSRTQAGLREDCEALRIEASSTKTSIFSEELQESVARLGANLSGVALVTTITFAERRLGYLGITRIDWPGAVLGMTWDVAPSWRPLAIEDSTERRAYVKRLRDWTRAYRILATEGYQRRFDTADLVANAPAASTTMPPQIADFSPSAITSRR